MARIYTRTGDDGTTGLMGGKRVSKDSPRIVAFGSLDELNAMIGIVRSHVLPDPVDGILQSVQEQLFRIGAALAAPDGGSGENAGIGEDPVRSLENEIDRLEETLPPLQQFILPGGTVAGAELHLARTVARRAERRCVSLSRIETVDSHILRYLNRLSDLCFVLARYVNRQQSAQERHPNSGNHSRQ